jgi:hypothetical protein
MKSADIPNGPSPRYEINFNRMLDDACNRLLGKKAELSIKKIRELEELLTDYEQELDVFIAGGDAHG